MKESTANLIRGILIMGPTFFFGFRNLISNLNNPSLVRTYAKTNDYLPFFLSLIGGFLIGAFIGLTIWTIVYFILKAFEQEVKYWAISFKRDNK